MKKIIGSTAIFALLTLVLTSCWPGQTYDKNGLSFDYPGGWKVTEDEFANSMGYLSLEKAGSNPKATIVFGWMESEAQIGADMMLAGIIRDMQTTDSLTDLVAEPAADVTYGQYPARAVTYTATQARVPVSGAVWVFRAEGRVMNVAVREGAEKANVAAFKTIKDSFTLK